METTKIPFLTMGNKGCYVVLSPDLLKKTLDKTSDLINAHHLTPFGVPFKKMYHGSYKTFGDRLVTEKVDLDTIETESKEKKESSALLTFIHLGQWDGKGSDQT